MEKSVKFTGKDSIRKIEKVKLQFFDRRKQKFNRRLAQLEDYLKANKFISTNEFLIPLEKNQASKGRNEISYQIGKDLDLLDRGEYVSILST